MGVAAFWRVRGENRRVAELVARFEGSVKTNTVYSLPFEATQMRHPKGNRAEFVLAAARVCRGIAAHLLAFGQVQLAVGVYLQTERPHRRWLPAFGATANPNNKIKTLLDLAGDDRQVQNFLDLLDSLRDKPGIYEIAPGLALFYDNGALKVTASPKFVRVLNNE